MLEWQDESTSLAECALDLKLQRNPASRSAPRSTKGNRISEQHCLTLQWFQRTLFASLQRTGLGCSGFATRCRRIWKSIVRKKRARRNTLHLLAWLEHLSLSADVARTTRYPRKVAIVHDFTSRLFSCFVFLKITSQRCSGHV